MTAFNAKASRAKRPCPLWVDAFQRDTQHLSADEVGAYMLILMAMWTRESCDLPDDDARLARIARVSLRLWRDRIGPVIRAFLLTGDGVVISRRLREEAAYVESEVQKQSDRKRGAYAKPQGNNDPSENDEINSSKLLINNDQHSTADNTADCPGYYPSQQPNNPTLSKEGGGGSARVREAENPPSPTDRERILQAMGLGSDDIAGPSKFLGGQADVAEAKRWLELPGITIDAVCVEVARMVAAKPDGPPSSFKYFTPAMQRLSAALSAPPLQPAPTTPPRRGPPDDRAAFDHALQAALRAAPPGADLLDRRSRDPFAQ